MPEARESLATAVKANLSAAAAAALFLYVIIGILKQSDAELILPSSVFDLGGLLKEVKEGIPGGFFITPILQVKIPLTLFYTLGPAGLLVVHAAVVLDRLALVTAVAPIRFLAIWAPPITLALIRWRFAPYVAARPVPTPIGLAMEALQTVALALDAAIVATALLRRPLDIWGATDRAVRFRAILARGCRHGATVSLIILLLRDVPQLISRRAVIGSAAIVNFALAVALLLPWLVEGGLFRASQQGLRRRWYGSLVVMEDLNMIGRTGLLAAFIGLAALPSFARALDLRGESLVAKTPVETLVETLLANEKTKPNWRSSSAERELWRNDTVQRIADARLVAWRSDGRGISLERWKFPGGHFDRANMALIRMNGANLQRASLDWANLVLADLTGADLKGASLRSASLDGARLSRVLADQASFSGATLIEATMTNLRAGAMQATDPTDAAALYEKCRKAKGPPDLRTDFSGAHMEGAGLEGADLSCANLAGATMDGQTQLKNAILIGADFSGADLKGAKFEGADLEFITMNRDTRLNGTLLQDANFSHAYLRGTDLSGAKGVDTANFDGADVTCAIFPTVFDKSKLMNAIVTGVRLAPPPGSLKGAMLMGAKQSWPNSEQEWEKLSVYCEPHGVPSSDRQSGGTQTPTGQPAGQQQPRAKP